MGNMQRSQMQSVVNFPDVQNDTTPFWEVMSSIVSLELFALARKLTFSCMGNNREPQKCPNPKKKVIYYWNSFCLFGMGE